MEVDQSSIPKQRSVFDVPLSYQRYCWVERFLKERTDIKSVSDLGCGNGRMIHWIKSVPHINRVNFIDKDDVMLEYESDIHMRPNIHEMLFGRENSYEPLNIRIFHGDISIPDQRLSSDCFTMIELIEHMLPEDLDRSVRTVFGFYQPKYVVVTTPNFEFNHLLNREPNQTAKFRHHDHKFEWTRSQFVEWSNHIMQHYPYHAEFDGVGTLPSSEPYGPCTQIAAFSRSDNHIQNQLERDLSCFDALLDKLNVRERVLESQIDYKQKKISLLNEFTVKGRDPKDFKEEPIESFDWSLDQSQPVS